MLRYSGCGCHSRIIIAGLRDGIKRPCHQANSDNSQNEAQPGETAGLTTVPSFCEMAQGWPQGPIPDAKQSHCDDDTGDDDPTPLPEIGQGAKAPGPCDQYQAK